MRFDSMTNRMQKEIYTRMWGKNKSVSASMVTKTPYRNTFLNNSYMFDVKGAYDKKDIIKKIFNINNPLFDDKYKQACSGSGNEEIRITTLHSSSLCALLFFYKISEEHPLIIEVDGEEVRFMDSIFEFQNKVTESGGPSNIDVTLLGTSAGHKVIMFIESKFSEYVVRTGMRLNIRNKYLETKYSDFIYDKAICDFWKKNDISIIKDKNEFQLKSVKKVYLEGIKQMISHYVGVRRFADKEYYDSNNCEKQKMQVKVREYVDDNTQIYLATILFEGEIGKINMNNESTYLENYKNIYNNLAVVLNEELIKDCNDRIKVLKEPLYYQKLFGKEESSITRFYFNV